jgi:hypothetical protein
MIQLKKVSRRTLDTINVAKPYLWSLYKAARSKNLFDDVETFCLFIGHARSGHSLIGSLLDAHPNAIIAHELGVLDFIGAGYSKRQIYYLLLENSEAFARAGRAWTGYSYQVPNQWQGRFQKLQIIGDKKGASTTQRLRDKPELLQLVQQRIGSPIKFVHIVRNPYDNISTMTRRQDASFDLERKIGSYFALCDTIATLKKQVPEADILDLRHEEFIADPKLCLSQLCHFLGLAAPNDYLEDCASIIYKTPHQSRYKLQWPSESIELIKRQIDKFAFLEGYSFEGY